ncbi:MAG: hypothetical protein U1E45_24975 [Geminicoccaceae bacterium]
MSITTKAKGPDHRLGTRDDHPVVIGPDGIAGTRDDWTDSNIDMRSGCFVVHGNLKDGISLPGNTVPLVEARFGGSQRPVLAEYRYGRGLVILDTLTKEFIAQNPYGYGYSVFMRNLFYYAMNRDRNLAARQ